ncbi:MAG: hypothetical protein Q9196_003599 [Gyalolechia fulgens]
MVQFFDGIPDHLAKWALTQPVFFTASAPLTGSHVNVSPKGLPSSTFTIFTPNSAAYIDATGSGSETVSHVYENGRVTIMFCSFDASPRILRFFCWGRIVEYDDRKRFLELLGRMGKEEIEGARAVVELRVWKVQTSCGYGVPYLSACPVPDADEVEGIRAELKDRETMGHWASKRIEKNELRKYQAGNNAYSLDGLPALRAALRDAGKSVLWERISARGRRVIGQKETLGMGVVMGILMVFLWQMVVVRFN